MEGKLQTGITFDPQGVVRTTTNALKALLELYSRKNQAWCIFWLKVYTCVDACLCSIGCRNLIRWMNLVCGFKFWNWLVRNTLFRTDTVQHDAYARLSFFSIDFAENCGYSVWKLYGFFEFFWLDWRLSGQYYMSTSVLSKTSINVLVKLKKKLKLLENIRSATCPQVVSCTLASLVSASLSQQPHLST